MGSWRRRRRREATCHGFGKVSRKVGHGSLGGSGELGVLDHSFGQDRGSGGCGSSSGPSRLRFFNGTVICLGEKRPNSGLGFIEEVYFNFLVCGLFLAWNGGLKFVFQVIGLNLTGPIKK